MKLSYILFLLIVAICGIANENTPIKVIQPDDNTLYAGHDSTFVIEIDRSKIDRLEIVLNSAEVIDLEINGSKETYCKAIVLDVGENNIVVNGYSNNKLSKSIKRNLYFHADVLDGSNEEDSEEYDIKYFHAMDNEQKCKKCHDMSSNIPTNGEVLEDVTQTTCYSCHQAKISSKNTHAPIANWLCLECHDGQFGEYNMDQRGIAKYLVRDPVAKTCGECHEKVESWFMQDYTHGPVNDGRCIRCHNPHGSDYEFFLRKPIWELCTTCHSEKANGKHVIPAIGFGNKPTAGGHPTKDRKDPARKGRDFYCSSCHNPHGSEGIFLLRMKGSFVFGVCQRCHQK